MPKFRVHLVETRLYDVVCEVEADTAERAEQLACADPVTFQVKDELIEVTEHRVEKVEQTQEG